MVLSGFEVDDALMAAYRSSFDEIIQLAIGINMVLYYPPQILDVKRYDH